MEPITVATANRLVTMVKNSAKSSVSTSSKNSKRAEHILEDEATAKRIQEEVKRALKEILDKEESDKRQEPYKENKEDTIIDDLGRSIENAERTLNKNLILGESSSDGDDEEDIAGGRF